MNKLGYDIHVHNISYRHLPSNFWLRTPVGAVEVPKKATDALRAVIWGTGNETLDLFQLILSPPGESPAMGELLNAHMWPEAAAARYIRAKALSAGMIATILGLSERDRFNCDFPLFTPNLTTLGWIHPKPRGVKLYPAMVEGFWKYTRAIKTIAETKTPGVSHCSPGGIGLYKDNSHPRHLIHALQAFPGIFLCAAHCGGENDEWRELILSDKVTSIEEITGSFLYWDTAFHNWRDPDYFNRLRDDIQRRPGRCLFGSDAPLCYTQGSYKEMIDAYKDNLGDYLWGEISYTNPRRFLGVEGGENGTED